MSTNPTAKLAPTVLITGRISATDHWPRRNPTRFTTLLRMPSADEYSTPATVELNSDHSLGKEGETITVEATVGGRYRSYNATDKETGESRVVKTADNLLTVVA